MIKGIIEARKCPSCGHHEIGVRIQDTDTFVPLIPGQELYIEGRRFPSFCHPDSSADEEPA